MKKKLGIIGGMGPLATADLLRMIIEKTDSENDAGHIRIFIDDNPQIPDRTASILSSGESPVPEIVKSGKLLEQMGADIILIPCNTSHYYYDEIQNQLKAEVLNMVEETVKKMYSAGVRKTGLLATTGTIKGKVYDKYLSLYGIEKTNITDIQQADIMNLIYSGVKAGRINYDASRVQELIDCIYQDGAQSIILGCTEIMSGCAMYGIKLNNYIEPMSVLSEVAIVRAGYNVKTAGRMKKWLH